MAGGVNAIGNLLGKVNANGALVVALDGGTASATLFLAGDGTAGAPSYSFTSDADNGAYFISANTWGLSAAGTLQFQIENGAVRVASTGLLGFGSDIALSRLAANLLGLATGDSLKLVSGVLVGGGLLSRLVTVTTDATAGVISYTAAQVAGGLILRDCNGAGRADTVPTAAALLAVIPGAQVGQAVRFTIRNTSGGATSITVTTNTGVTLSGTMTIAQNNSKDFLAVFTNVTAASEAYTLYSLGTVVF